MTVLNVMLQLTHAKMLLFTEHFFPFFPARMHPNPSMVLVHDCVL